MHVIEEVVYQQAVNLLLVGTGLFATSRAYARHASTDTGASTAEIPTV